MSQSFDVVVADPPWSFGDKLPGPGRGAEKHYRCLSVDEICGFELPPIADNAWLFLWRVGSQQEAALRVVRAWGFDEPTSEIVWVKTSKAGAPSLRVGMGRTVRNCHEVCLVCRRGRPVRANAGVPSVLFAPRGRHSAKPDEFFWFVERLVGPTANKVELFARRRRDGWTCLGDEVKAG